jgi:hypothetical protein
MELNFGALPKASLNLFQNGEVVYGSGAIVLDSKIDIPVASGGTILGNQLNLDMISMGSVSLYRASMTESGNSATGSYTADSPNANPISHTITEIKSTTSG